MKACRAVVGLRADRLLDLAVLGINASTLWRRRKKFDS